MSTAPLRFRRLPKADWHPDTNICLGCSSFFGVFKRRHHCRACGRCFCSSCADQDTPMLTGPRANAAVNDQSFSSSASFVTTPNAATASPSVARTGGGNTAVNNGSMVGSSPYSNLPASSTSATSIEMCCKHCKAFLTAVQDLLTRSGQVMFRRSLGTSLPEAMKELQDIIENLKPLTVAAPASNHLELLGEVRDVTLSALEILAQDGGDVQGDFSLSNSTLTPSTVPMLNNHRSRQQLLQRQRPQNLPRDGGGATDDEPPVAVRKMKATTRDANDVDDDDGGNEDGRDTSMPPAAAIASPPNAPTASPIRNEGAEDNAATEEDNTIVRDIQLVTSTRSAEYFQRAKRCSDALASFSNSALRDRRGKDVVGVLDALDVTSLASPNGGTQVEKIAMMMHLSIHRITAIFQNISAPHINISACKQLAAVTWWFVLLLSVFVAFWPDWSAPTPPPPSPPLLLLPGPPTPLCLPAPARRLWSDVARNLFLWFLRPGEKCFLSYQRDDGVCAW